jgi:precorrin-6B methylase 2
MILKQLTSLKPLHLLDVGCASGSFTSKISPYCDRITAIDSSEDYLKDKSGAPYGRGTNFYYLYLK